MTDNWYNEGGYIHDKEVNDIQRFKDCAVIKPLAINVKLGTIPTNFMFKMRKYYDEGLSQAVFFYKKAQQPGKFDLLVAMLPDEAFNNKALSDEEWDAQIIELEQSLNAVKSINIIDATGLAGFMMGGL